MQFWLLYGSQGWIGSQFQELLDSRTDIRLIKGEARCEKYCAVEEEIKSLRELSKDPGMCRVISFVGRTSAPCVPAAFGSESQLQATRDTKTSTIDYLERPEALHMNIQDNVLAPINIERVCSKYNIHFTYMSSGCIFSYTGKGDTLDSSQPTFRTDSSANFFGSAYSTAKGITDSYMQKSPRTLNVRIRIPITAEHHPKNFITKLLSYEKIHSTYNSCTVLPDLLPVLAELVFHGNTGTYHLVNPTPMTHGEILTLYRNIVDPSRTWTEVPEEELVGKKLIARRSRCILESPDAYHFENKTIIVPSLPESLARIFSQQWKSEQER